MQHKTTNNRELKRRQRITIAVAIFAAVASIICLILMRSALPHMHIIFYLVLGISLLLLTYMLLWILSADRKYLGLAKFLKVCYIIFLVAGLICFLILQGLIYSGAHTDEGEIDVLIVMGAGLRDGVPSLMLATRLDTAINYLQNRENIPVIVTGGLGAGQTITEARAMSRYLQARGIDRNYIWEENLSTNSRENLIFAIEIMAERGLDIDDITVGIVSSEFHLYRIRLIAERLELDAVGIAAETPGAHRRAINQVREAVSLALEWLRGDIN